MSQPAAIEHAPEPPPEPEPNWPRTALVAFVGEWREFFGVLVAVTLHPQKFAADWAEGRRHALNPLACVLNAFGIQVVWSWLTQRLVGVEMPSLLQSFYDPLIHLAALVGSASLYHFPLRWMGGRGRWRTSVGAVLFITAGPLLLFQLVTAPLALLTVKHTGRSAHLQPAQLLVTALSLPQFAYYVLVQIGAHRMVWWRALVAFVIYVAIFLAIVGVLVFAVAAPWLRQHPEVLRSLMPPDML